MVDDSRMVEALGLGQRHVEADSEMSVVQAAISVGAGAATVWLVVLNALCMAIACIAAYVLSRVDRD
jgi:hypothetical protein